MIDEECLYGYLKNNVDWLCPCDNCLYWLRNLFREFEFTFTNQWMKYLERKLFQKRLYINYKKESNHESDYY